ncbi:unnamed protein product [Pedinophyceae sp. YPF-701]|nr:unnamed protein product [Pedinophyceae sp. YPF-701]
MSVRASAAPEFKSTSERKPSSEDLLIVGPGVLGSVAGLKWLEAAPQGSTALGQTNTETRHGKLREMGLAARTREEAANSTEKFPFVLFSAPPSGSADYVAEVQAALDLWDGTGSFLFTSSGSVFEAKEGKVTETSPTAPEGSRTPAQERLLRAEAAVLERGGNVLRLVGLYHAGRGAHTYFLKVGEVERWGGYTVNLIHYEDAASLAVAILRGRGSEGYYRGSVFVGSDNHPITFDDMMEATRKCPQRYEGAKEVKFTATEPGPGGPGKEVDSSATNEQLGWGPIYLSFQTFMAAGGKDRYTDDLPIFVGAPHA